MSAPRVVLTVDVEGDFGTSSLRGVDEVLPRLLDRFEALGARAVLFAVGAVARERPAAMRDAVARGHVVGSHSMTHAALGSLPRERVRAELRDSRAAIEDVTGAPCVCFRAPFFDAPRDLGPRLAEAGYRWSSSKAPFSPVAGYRNALSQAPHLLAGSDVVELPVPGVMGLPLPQGLSYHRLFGALTRLSSTPPRVFYLHPYELLDRVEGFALPRWMRPFVLRGQGAAAAATLDALLVRWQRAGAVFEAPTEVEWPGVPTASR